MPKVQKPKENLKDAFTKFLSENREHLLQYHGEVIDDLVGLLLASSSQEEVQKVEEFLTPFLSERGDVFQRLSSQLERIFSSTEMAQLPSRNRYEYFAVLALMLATQVKPAVGPGIKGNLNEIAWAEAQAGKAIEAALDGYVSHLFPGREADVYGLLDIALTELLRRFFSDFQTTILPAVKPILKKAIQVPGVFDVLKVGIEEFEQEGKAQIPSSGGKAKHQVTKPLKAYAIQKYQAGQWKNPRRAAADIYPLVVNEFGDVLKDDEGQGEITVYRWLLAYDRECDAKTGKNQSAS